MANLEKFTRHQVVGLLAHDYRQCENHTNEKIDSSRSMLNYQLASDAGYEKYKERISQIYVLNRKDVNTMGCLSITLPKELKTASLSQQKEFFKSCYEFARADFGENNIFSAMVHNDETTPHIHIKFIPVVVDKKKGIEKCSYKEKCGKAYYQHLHERLEQKVCSDLNMKLSIITEETKENKTIQQLKLESKKKLVEEIKVLKEEKKKIIEENKTLIDKRKEIKVVHTDLIQPKKVLMKDYVPYEEYVKQFNTFKKNETQLINENDKLIERDKKLNNLVGDIVQNVFTKAKEVHSFLLMNNPLYKKIATPIVNRVLSEENRQKNLQRFYEAKNEVKNDFKFRSPFKTKSNGIER